jgi:endogenous inhibitor of DNA gyrase (YacG/DUF329 family)
MTDSKPRPPCPICKKPNRPEFRPFCSERCADIDLGKWFSGAYVVPGEPVSSDEIPASERDDSSTS